MDTAKLKKFAQAARTGLLKQVAAKLALVLEPDSAARREQPLAISELERQIKDSSRDQVVERVAYTWFNRIIALRFMDLSGYSRIRVVSPTDESQVQPEILAEAKMGHIDEERVPERTREQVRALLGGTAPAHDPQQEAYRLLLVAECNSFHRIMPFLFERIADYTELLMPDDLLSANSILAATREAMTPEACGVASEGETCQLPLATSHSAAAGGVEVIGWLYQFYIAEKKDEVMARKRAVPTEDIPAVTQLFTPHWIVRYLVENSLGRLWLLNRPGSRLREQMPYYIEGEPETDFLQITRPEEIRVLDPAVGSGHMLTYAFDLLTLIYEEEGYAPAEIPGLILQHNLYGLEICPRAAQLAGLALVLKARAKTRRFFQPERFVRPHIVELQNITFTEGELAEYFKVLGVNPSSFIPKTSSFPKLLHEFEEAKTFGSLIQPCLDEPAIAFARCAIEAKDVSGQLFLHDTHRKVLRVLEQAEALTQRYHVVVANPPYLGIRQTNASIKNHAENLYPQSKPDLYSMFIERCLIAALPKGAVGMVTMQSWMFLTSFEAFRTHLFARSSISSMAHLGPRAFDTISGEVVQTTAFILTKSIGLDRLALYLDATSGMNETAKERLVLERLNIFRATLRDIFQIPGKAVAYWISPRLRRLFTELKPLSNVAQPRQGMATSDNARFLRYWHEVGANNIAFGCRSHKDSKARSEKWYPYNKGGSFRRWSGNNDYVVNWQHGGEELKAFVEELNKLHPGGRLKNQEFYFRENLTYNALAGGDFSCRHNPPGFLFDTKGSCIFIEQRLIWNLLGFLNSQVCQALLDVLCPTLDYSSIGLNNTPYQEDEKGEEVVKAAVMLAAADWDNFETSWDFRDHPLLRPELKAATLEASWQNWETHCNAAIRRMQELETENNRLFIAAYGLEADLSPEVPEDQITLARPDARRDMSDFLSYAVGCMFGRYSLDTPGLILANQGETLADFVQKVASGQWLVASRSGEHNEREALQGSDRVAEGHGSGAVGLSGHQGISQGGTVRIDQPGPSGGGFDSVQYRGRAGETIDSRVQKLPIDSERLIGGSRNSIADRNTSGLSQPGSASANHVNSSGNQQNDPGADDKTNHWPLATSHSSFLPDEDNVIPILDGDWFPDDITERFRHFLRVTFGEAHYADNLAFIEAALGKDLRKYFIKDFYADHVKRYKKRPIYWLFTSPKGTFNALIYLHRYRPDTVSVVLQYLRDFRQKLAARLDHLQQVGISTSASQAEKTRANKAIDAIKKQLLELEDYERDTLYPLATEQIALDLDDGVKGNYLKLGPALKTIPGLARVED